jgi:hypothetical protein
MKRLIGVVALTAALAVGVTTATAAAPTEPPSGLGCLDIVGGGFFWATTNDFTGSMSLAAPACKQATYTLVVLPDANSTTPLATLAGTPAGLGDVISFSGTVTDSDTTVCVYATSAIGGHVFDVGAPPDQPCLLVEQDSSSGGTPFQ